MVLAQLSVPQEGWAALVLLPIAVLAGLVYGFLVPVPLARRIALSLALVVPISCYAAASDWLADSEVLDDWFSVSLVVYLAFCLALGGVLLCRRSYRGIGLCLTAGSLVPYGGWILALSS